VRRVAIIGPGRVGGALALGLQAAGDEVVAVAGGSATAVAAFRALAPQADARPVHAVAEGTDLVLVTTPDDAIAGVVASVAAAEGITEGQRWVHVAGGRGVEPLAAAHAAGARVAACHPAMTFPDPVAGAERLPGVSWAVTAAPVDVGWAQVLVTDLRGRPVVIAPGDRRLYHAGLAVGSNATTAVVALARDLLLGAGVDDPAAFLTPLVVSSAEGGAARGVDALTGPVRRGDVGTVRGHLDELATSFPDAVGAYVALAELILSQAVRAGLSADRAAAVREVLRAAVDEVGR
jgi:predicted short-subunit dehydrogenase-like oxidoreductase (DUF2520 family)